MINTFLEGETYSNVAHSRYAMVLAIAEESKKEFILAVLWVDPESQEGVEGGELVVSKKDLGSWEVVEFQ